MLRVYLNSMAGGVILDIAYGIKTKPRNDPYVEAAERALSAVTTVVSPSARLFDMFPMRESQSDSPSMSISMMLTGSSRYRIHEQYCICLRGFLELV